MPVVELGGGWIPVLNAAAWIVVFLVTGTIAAHLSDRSLEAQRWLLRPRRFERAGRFYERRLHVARWKDRVPDAGSFSGGASKRRLPDTEGRGIERFELETRRSELAHWLPIAAVPLFAIWNPLVGVAVNAGFAVAVNAPFIAIQRYNRLRVQRVLDRRAARRSGSAADASG